MKKLLAMLLSLVMLLVFVPATLADGADFTMFIEGGEVSGSILKVDVTMSAAISDTVCGMAFELNYDSTKITYQRYEANDAFGTPTINDTKPGAFRYAIAGTENVTITDDMNVVTLYFKIADGLETGTEIAFTLADGAYAETGNPSRPVAHDIAADFNPYVIGESAPFTGVVKFNDGEVSYKGSTPYVIYDHAAGKHEPAFTVYEEDGETVVDPSHYDYEYQENTLPGTGYLFVTFKNGYSGEAQLWFKIYLPATKQTKVENVAAGIRITWAPVDGAAGYVIYRRAWSTTTNGWTSFERWWNVTGTEWIDGTDDAHKVYAGTRYQYGVKAYFERRLDPVAGSEIGGNVNEPSGNYNLGEVGPLRTTVRITTRVLDAVEAGTKQMTVKWTPSGLFTGYEIQYATDENFTQPVSVEVATRDADNQIIREKVITGLTAGTYYVRIRSYHEFEGFTYVGEWSNVLSCTVK